MFRAESAAGLIPNICFLMFIVIVI